MTRAVMFLPHPFQAHCVEPFNIPSLGRFLYFLCKCGVMVRQGMNRQ